MAVKIIVDIGGGRLSLDHLARFIRDTDAALELSRTELAKGFLVNLRADINSADYTEFDNRKVN